MSVTAERLHFAVSPDFNARELSPWFVLNTRLQRMSGLRMHLDLHSDFATLRAAATRDELDLIYANAFDTALLVRERGFAPLVRPTNRPDEAVIVSARASDLTELEQLSGGVLAGATQAPEVEAICRVMLEPVITEPALIHTQCFDNYVRVTRGVLSGEVEVGFLLARSYVHLSPMIRDQLRVLAESRISVVRHALLAGPRLLPLSGSLRQGLLAMREGERDRALLVDLDLADGWEEMTGEDAEFMIDLIDTLVA